jgi:hypothetical protein
MNSRYTLPLHNSRQYTGLAYKIILFRAFGRPHPAQPTYLHFKTNLILRYTSVGVQFNLPPFSSEMTEARGEASRKDLPYLRRKSPSNNLL